MAKPFRKMSVSERVLQKRLTSSPPKGKGEAAAAEPLRVAPLAPPPAFDELLGSGPVAPAPAEDATRAPAPEVEAPKVAKAPEVEAPKAVEAPRAAAAVAEKAAPAEPLEADPPRLGLSGLEDAPEEAPDRDFDGPVDSSAPSQERPGRTKLAMAALAAFATVVGVGIGVRVTKLRAARQAAARAAAAQVAPSVEAPAMPSPPPPPPAETAAATAAQAAAPSSTSAATGDPGAAAGQAASAAASSTPSAAPSADPASSAAPVTQEERVSSARALREESLTLLKKSMNPQAMAKASAALDADPSDAMPYLVLGSALQEVNRWREARRAYELCVKNATKGMVDECRAMLRRR